MIGIGRGFCSRYRPFCTYETFLRWQLLENSYGGSPRLPPTKVLKTTSSVPAAVPPLFAKIGFARRGLLTVFGQGQRRTLWNGVGCCTPDKKHRSRNAIR